MVKKIHLYITPRTEILSDGIVNMCSIQYILYTKQCPGICFCLFVVGQKIIITFQKALCPI